MTVVVAARHHIQLGLQQCIRRYVRSMTVPVALVAATPTQLYLGVPGVWAMPIVLLGALAIKHYAILTRVERHLTAALTVVCLAEPCPSLTPCGLLILTLHLTMAAHALECALLAALGAARRAIGDAMFV